MAKTLVNSSLEMSQHPGLYSPTLWPLLWFSTLTDYSQLPPRGTPLSSPLSTPTHPPHCFIFLKTKTKNVVTPIMLRASFYRLPIAKAQNPNSPASGSESFMTGLHQPLRLTPPTLSLLEPQGAAQLRTLQIVFCTENLLETCHGLF